MNLDMLKPWNWFKHEEDTDVGGRLLPVSREMASTSPAFNSTPLVSLHRELDRWFDEAMQSFGGPSSLSNLKTSGVTGMSPARLQSPRIDVAGDANRYEINLDVPGFEESDLSLELNGEVLTIKGRKEQRSEDRDKQYYRVERSYGSFQRTLALPEDAITDEIEAALEKGVLRLEIPRRPTTNQEVKRIAINS